VSVLQRIVLIVVVLVVVWRIAVALGRRRRQTGFGADSYVGFRRSCGAAGASGRSTSETSARTTSSPASAAAPTFPRGGP
jgi:hypothetical protein